MIKNVIIVCDYGYIEGGASKVAIQTALSLAKQTDLNVFFLAGCGDICSEIKESNIISKSLNMYDLLGNPSKIDAFLKGIYNRQVEKEFKALLKSLVVQETIVHIHTWTKVLSSAIFKACKDIGVKTYLTLHDYFLTCPNGACYDYVKKKICEKMPMSIKCMRCNCDSRSYIYKIWRCMRQIIQNYIIYNFEELNYIFISEFQKKQILRRCNHIKKYSFVKNIISENDRFKVSCEENYYFLYMGRVCKEKGTSLFCEAVSEADVPGIVVGDGPLFKELKEKYKDIKFVGWKDKSQISSLLKSVRALVFPTLWYEGSPLTIPEVQAYGIPCIVTDCSAATDDIDSRINGEIVKNSLYEIEQAILRFKDDEYIKMLSQNAYQMFDEKRTSEEWYVSNLIGVYEKG